MLPDLVSNPGPLTYESGALPIALRGPAKYYLGYINVAKVSRMENVSMLQRYSPSTCQKNSKNMFTILS